MKKSCRSADRHDFFICLLLSEDFWNKEWKPVFLTFPTIRINFLFLFMATRFTLLFLLILISSLFAYAQIDTTGAALNHEAMTLFKQGEYVRAILLAEKAVKQTEKEFGKQHLNYAITLDNLGGLYRTTGQYAKAAPLLEECLVIKENVLGKLTSSYAATLSSLARTYELMGHYAKSLRLFEIDLKNTELSKGETHPEYASVLVNLAGIYQSLG